MTRARAAVVLAASSGVLLTSIAVLDSDRGACRFWGLALVAGALAIDRVLGCAAPIRWLGAFAVALAIATVIPIRFGADSLNYVAYLRSAAFDHDLDFRNEWTFWGHGLPATTATGHVTNPESVGPALLWSPFYLLAHLYVLASWALGGSRFAPDGYSAPYLQATVIGTLFVATAGAWLLARALARRGPGAALAVATAVFASPVLYYVTVSPAMSHGLEFGTAAFLVWALLGARESNTQAAWMKVGLAWGLVTTVRWQALVFGLLVVPLALVAWRSGKARLETLLLAGGIAVLVLSPQLLAWRIVYGSFLTMPQGSGFMDWSSPHFLDTLLSANHGLFTWTPAMLLGAAGLLLALRADALFATGALAVLGATAWVNGGVSDWWGSDAFGARRFTLVVPLLAVGLAELGRRLASLARRMPLALPALLFGFVALQNAAFVAAFRVTRYPEAAPIERVAEDRASVFREAVQDLGGLIAGARGRAFVYRGLSGEYLFTAFNRTGALNLGEVRDAELAGRWSPRRRLPDGPSFRWALPPRSCVRLPLEAPFPLRVVISLRARSADQRVTIQVNDKTLSVSPVSVEWSELAVRVPKTSLVPGENWLCLRFAREGRDDNDPPAAVARVQVRNDLP